MTKLRTIIAIAVGTLFAGAAFAQSNRDIEQRDRAEQARIDRGIQSGQITSREAARLNGERAQIERMESRARADGHLSGGERARIDRAQDRLGRDIYRESHDRQTSNGHGRGDGRPGWNSGHGNGNGNAWGHGNESRGSNYRDSSHARADDIRGRSDAAPGRQPHDQQSDSQRTHVQHAQASRSTTRPERTGGGDRRGR
jgi:hypothetical protein